MSTQYDFSGNTFREELKIFAGDINCRIIERKPDWKNELFRSRINRDLPGKRADSGLSGTIMVKDSEQRSEVSELFDNFRTAFFTPEHQQFMR